MPRGYGHVQRLILGSLTQIPDQTILDLGRRVYGLRYDDPPTKSQLSCVGRALSALSARGDVHKSGRIDKFGYHCWMVSSYYKPVTRATVKAKLRAQKPRLVGI